MNSLPLLALDGFSLARAEAVNRGWREGCIEGDCWQRLVLGEYGWIVHSVPWGSSWKQLYFRLALSREARLFMIGGRHDFASAARVYNLSTRQWTKAPAPPDPRNMGAIVRHSSGALVAIGGGFVKDSQYLALRTVATLCETEWKELSLMNVSRCCCAAAVDCRGRTYVVGGGENMFANSEAWSSVEMCTDIMAGAGNDAWCMAPNMIDRRCALGAAYSFDTDELFAAGGYAGERRYLNTAERLPLSGDSCERWEMLPPMSCKRAGCVAAVGPDRRLFVVGGGPDGRTEHSSVEALDPREPRWQTDLAPAKVGRHYGTAAFGPDGWLYVAGTFRHGGQLDVVERYDPRRNCWEDLPPIGAVIQYSSGIFIF